jgi:hemerythrin superfamily protein
MAKAKKQDVLSLIEADHRKVENLFEQAKNAEGKKLYDCFTQIYTELSLHARAEELSFYPAMREHEETEDYLEEAESEHAEAEVLLERLKNMKPDDPAFQEMLEELQKAVKHHVEEEESEIFAAARECMDEEELIELGQEFQQAKAGSEEDVKEAIAT